MLLPSTDVSSLIPIPIIRIRPIPDLHSLRDDPMATGRYTGASLRRLGRPPLFPAVHEPCREECRALVQVYRVWRAGIEQRRTPRPAVILNILVQARVEAEGFRLHPRLPPEAARAERRAHRRAAKNEARSQNDLMLPAPNFAPNFASILSPACVRPQSWTPLSSGPAPRDLPSSPAPSSAFSVVSPSS